MKIRIEIDKDIYETEVIIRCSEIDEDVMELQNALLDKLASVSRLRLYNEGEEFYLSPSEILFFESSDGRTWAHTEKTAFEAKQSLRDLEATLPRSFVRVSKSAIVNANKVYSIERNLTGPSTVRFRGSYKQISASRKYFRMLCDRLGP